ncbi:hypothetical protein OPAG_07613 [Rhodococcus opacus PD630]|uniref:hypothetical protein n=1 Tax=Rhodococcus opacus TaxID=37919 RepID=UPI00029CC32C|nr:hypothetical protein [Rhodococcus opacus]AHK27320.1 hypothetical protein Pd630_LPD00073 [Rhodococcus opacus PD630]EHI41418.1 hypothetical protein OPAG_07613 [Rhodococcus opacus PD630]UDG97328.1 hypothetical protein K2Z90_000070 [Rhodococcus opacus PD630]
MTTSGRMGPDNQSVNTAPVDDLHKRPENTHWILYSVLSVAFVGLLVWGLVAFDQHKQSAEAVAKATELSERFQRAGLGSLDVDATARVLGTDGAAACTDPDNALKTGVLDQQLVSGAAGPGQRPILATGNLVEGERQVIAVYCPDRSAEFESAVADLKLVDEN